MMIYFRSITTKYFGPSNVKGSRIIATASGMALETPKSLCGMITLWASMKTTQKPHAAWLKSWNGLAGGLWAAQKLVLFSSWSKPATKSVKALTLQNVKGFDHANGG